MKDKFIICDYYYLFWILSFEQKIKLIIFKVLNLKYKYLFKKKLVKLVSKALNLTI